ncbi:NAD(P)-binding protein [Fistulina hepatica ATCC 64428]|uniref:Probable quinone oxidoreductase n=1 Tax=Fistulina hepatica ATCC 64428 TaxID=1128425 RepID=A0A0D7AJG2_9AGAR|nr:NAD(P)-binding protein [Fistulina hepatica ATCC 64428]
MSAHIIHGLLSQTGGPEVIKKLTVPFPTVQPGDVVIKTDYLGVNFIDTYFRQGLYPLKSFPAGIGKETAGTVVALPTDPTVLADPDFQKLGLKVGNKVAADQLGSHSTYISVPWTVVYPIPAGVSTLTGAAALLQGLTALTFAEEAYAIQKGDTVLIHTAAGGLGLLLVQLAKARGATVIGTTSTPEKAEIAKANGVDHIILYKNENTEQRVLELTNGEGVDAVFDGVGKDTFELDLNILRRKGTLVSIGNASGAIPPFQPLRLSAKNIKLCRPMMSNYVYTPAEKYNYSQQLFKLIATDALKIKVFQEYPFTAEGVQQAQKDLVTGKTIGKLVIKVD